MAAISASLTPRTFGSRGGVPSSAHRDERGACERGSSPDALRRPEPLSQHEPREHQVTTGYRLLSTATIPTAPRVVAAAKQTFAAVSKTPTATTSGRRRRGAVRADRSRVPRRRRRTADAARCSDRPARRSRLRRVDPHEDQPEAERRDDREPGAGGDPRTSVLCRFPGQDDDARQRRARRRATELRSAPRLGSADRERDDRRGRRDGATIPIAPSAKPGKRAGRREPPRLRPRRAGAHRLRERRACDERPRRTTPTAAVCEIDEGRCRTAGRRDPIPPKKSPTPHPSAPASASRAATRGQSSPTERVAAWASSWLAW